MEPFLTTALKLVWLIVGIIIIVSTFTDAF